MKQVTTTKLDRWLTAMRLPGLYQQVHNAYCDEHGFCGLGVMAAEAGIWTPEIKTGYLRYVETGVYGYPGALISTLCTTIREELKAMTAEIGLDEDCAKLLGEAVPFWNDARRWTLPQIADGVEKLVAAWQAAPDDDRRAVAVRLFPEEF